MSVKNGYKEVIKRIRRLPVEDYTLIHLKMAAKDTKSFIKFTTLLDDILVYENWSSLHKVFDYIYKDVLGSKAFESQYNAYKTFNNYNYDELRDIYPSVHLFKELDIPESYLSSFDERLKEEQSDFSLVSHFKLKKLPPNGPSHIYPFKLIERDTQQTNISKVVSEIKHLYDFLLKTPWLTHLTLQPFEITYPPDQFGNPLHIRSRDKLLQQKINMIKSVIHQHRPIPLKAMKETCMKHKGPISTNGNFFKYMKWKRQHVHVIIKGNKKFIPDEKNITKIYKDYFCVQCYYDKESRTYVSSPVKYYEE